MTHARQPAPTDELASAVAEARQRIEALLHRIAEVGGKGITFEARISEKGSVSVAVHQEQPEAVTASLNACQLDRLPLGAIVAWATRCARRSLPFLIPWVSNLEVVLAVDRALCQAQEIAKGNWHLDLGTFSSHLDITSSIASSFPASPQDAATLAGNHAANAAFDAIYCAYEAAYAASRQTSSEGVIQRAQRTAYESAMAGAHAAEAVTGAALISPGGLAPTRQAATAFVQGMENDYQRLVRLALGDFPDRGAPIDSSDCGPLGHLWPDGLPDWYSKGLGTQGWKSIEQVRDELGAGEQQSYQRALKLEQIEEWVAEKERMGWTRKDFARRLGEILGIQLEESSDE